MGEGFMTTTESVQTMVRLSVAAYALALASVAVAQQGQPAPSTRAASPAADGIANEKSFAAIESGKWTGKRLPDGQPDVAGDWSNTIANHDNFTDPQGGIPGDPSPVARSRKLGPREERAPSRVSDPADGELPYQPWARAKQQEFAVGFFNAVKPEYIEPLARCAPSGIPKSFYWHGYEIRQYPGYVVFLFGSGWRIIHLDGKPHLPANIKLWNGDSRGHWEGITLVVDTTNYNGKGMIATSGATARIRGIHESEALHVVERFKRVDANTISYEVTIDDPNVYSAPWKVSLRLTKDANYLIYEYACHEGNYAMEGILRAGRAKDKAAETVAK